MKKNYQKPTMTVIEMRRRAALLTVSEGGDAKKAKEWDGELGYIPGFTDDTHLA